MRTLFLLIFTLYPLFEKINYSFDEWCNASIYNEEDFNLSCKNDSGLRYMYPVEGSDLIILNSSLPTRHFLISSNFEIKSIELKTPHNLEFYNNKIKIEKGKILIKTYYLHYSNTNFNIVDENNKILFSFSLPEIRDIFEGLSSFYSDGDNFIFYFYENKEYNPENPLLVHFVWGNKKKIYHQKYIFPEVNFIDVIENLGGYEYGDYGISFIFDNLTFKNDPKGFWGGLSFYISEGSIGLGGLIFLPLDGSKVKVYQPLWMLLKSTRAISVLGEGYVAFSLVIDAEGGYSEEFLNPYLFDLKNKKISQFLKLTSKFETPIKFILKNRELWVLTIQKLYCFSIENLKEPLAIFALSYNGQDLLRLCPEIIEKTMGSEIFDEWFWGLRFASEMGYKENINLLRKTFYNLDKNEKESKFINILGGRLEPYKDSKNKGKEIIKHYILKGLIRAGDKEFFKDLFKNLEEGIKIEGISNFPLNYYLEQVKDKDLISKIVNLLEIKGVDAIYSLPFYYFFYSPPYAKDILLQSYIKPITENLEKSDFEKLMKAGIYDNEIFKKYLCFYNGNNFRQIILKKIEEGYLTKQEIIGIGRLKIKEGLKLLKKIFLDSEVGPDIRFEAMRAIYEMEPDYFNDIRIENDLLKKCLEALKRDPNFDYELIDD